MSSTEVRNQIDLFLNQVDDRFLIVIHAMLGTYIDQQNKVSNAAGYDIDGTPRTHTELTAMLDKQVQEGRNGNYLSLEELRKASDQWLNPTK